MILVVDVGNTNIVMGIYDGDILVANWRLSTLDNRTSDETGMIMSQFIENMGFSIGDINDVIISSVVPSLMHTLDLAMQKFIGIKPMIVTNDMNTGINIKYDNPKEVGADRIVNAVAGLEIYGGPLIIIDFGTATTFCAIDKDRNYLGGVICPGIKISMESLFEKTAKLPRIEIANPGHIIGTNTVESMQSGAVFGYTGQVEYIVEKMKKELGDGTKVIATGGMARMISEETVCIDEVNSKLTLEGLKILYKMNKM